VPPVALFEPQTRPLQDLGVQLAAVIDHDHDGRCGPQRATHVREHRRNAFDVCAQRRT